MAFKPRTTCPSQDDKCWIVTSYGGYNKCILGSAPNRYSVGSALPNCVGYAWGRFLEVMRQHDASITTCDLPRSDAKDFIKYNTAYEVGQEPRLGAVAVFLPNHVAIVEKIDSNGVCTLSESGWGGPIFHYGNTISKAANYNDHDWRNYTLLGFIYNPYGEAALSQADAFAAEATKHIGETGMDWTWPTFGTGNIEWCAAFVSAVAETVGVSGKYIYSTASVTDLAKQSTALRYGTFHLSSSGYTPVIGDLVFFRYTNSERDSDYACDHVGIIIDSSSDEIITVEGNTQTNNKYTSVVSRRTYSTNATSIHAYFHPRWETSSATRPFYSDISTTRKDMTLREIGYLDRYFKPSIHSSRTKLSAINYTGLFAALLNLLPGDAAQTVNTDRLESKARITVDYLLSKGLNSAAACGVAANIFHESGFNTAAVGDYGTSFGICQWHLERGSDMKKMVGSSWANNLTGQLEYLWYELTTSYRSSTLVALQSVDNTADGCQKAADIFVRRFEIPAEVDKRSIERQSTALRYFNQIIV